ncbi:hypothetical protein NVS55_28580 [Myxococcus stipitatus]|uniref:hypothetical protein n=1 Tax=Myxococcus stipitatus TaxID=83455 RepID=UPI0031454FB6
MDKTLITSCILALVSGTPALAAEPTPSFETRAKEHCQKSLSIPSCNQVKPPGPFIKRCVEDAVLTGSFEFVETARKDYLRACQRLTPKPAPSKP